MSALEDLAIQSVKLAMDRGATAAECTFAEGEEFSVNLRMREIESLKEAGSRAGGIRVLLGTRSGSSYTSDLSRQGLEHMVASAIELAGISSEDPHAGLPDHAELGIFDADLALYDDQIAQMPTSAKLDQAREAEETALSADPRIRNSEGASFRSHLGLRAFANSLGFSGSYPASSCSLSVSPVAKENGSMERDYWHTASRRRAGLESPGDVGRRAAERALRRLNPRKVATQKAPVVFEPRTARSLLGDLFDAVNGSAVYRKASFLAGKLGERVASAALTVIDDATIPGLFGSSPFDDEGVKARRTVVVERGILKSYLLNTYSAKKLDLKTTGNASRGLSGNAGVGPGNFFIEPGVETAEQILHRVGHGLFVTELIGSGADPVTGDFSCGAAGLWIEHGELAYPVSEITIAGNLKRMLMELESVGSDLEFRGAVASPTLLIPEMTISGK